MRGDHLFHEDAETNCFPEAHGVDFDLAVRVHPTGAILRGATLGDLAAAVEALGGEDRTAFADFCVQWATPGPVRELKLLSEAIGQLQWCGGADDFAPDGKARLGWERGPAKTIERLVAMVKGTL